MRIIEIICEVQNLDEILLVSGVVGSLDRISIQRFVDFPSGVAVDFTRRPGDFDGLDMRLHLVYTLQRDEDREDFGSMLGFWVASEPSKKRDRIMTRLADDLHPAVRENHVSKNDQIMAVFFPTRMGMAQGRSAEDRVLWRKHGYAVRDVSFVMAEQDDIRIISFKLPDRTMDKRLTSYGHQVLRHAGMVFPARALAGGA
jgi:hypothetical protein